MLVQSRTVGFIEPVAGIKRQQFDFRPIREVGGLVHDKSSCSDTGFNGHGPRRNTSEAAQQQGEADGGDSDQRSAVHRRDAVTFAEAR